MYQGWINLFDEHREAYWDHEVQTVQCPYCRSQAILYEPWEKVTGDKIDPYYKGSHIRWATPSLWYLLRNVLRYKSNVFRARKAGKISEWKG